MRCTGCGHDSPSDARFCEQCGVPLEVACPQCGETLRPTARFCKRCGHRLVDAGPVPSSPPTAASAASPRRYTPKHLVDRILRTRSALEGERKQVTVLFCDIVDSSALAQALDPEVMHEVMNRALALMADAVHRHEGTVNQFLGDGLMALFGAPVAVEEHALRGVEAALAILETIGGYSEQLKVERGVEIRLRLGLNSGPVVVGRIGDDLRMDYTAVGDTTHLAARLQGLAEPGTIAMTEATRRLVEGYIRSEALGRVEVKGRSEPVAVHRVLGRQRRRSRLEVSAERGLTPLVGRQRELGVLHDCLARVKTGRGQAVGIVGEPGAGKSRLVHEFRQSLGGDRITWLEGHCVSSAQATPYSPILDVLAMNFQVDDRDNPLQIGQKLRGGLRELDPTLEDTLPFLGALFGVLEDDEALRYLDPKDKRQRTFEAIRTLTAAGSRRRPHVVVIEDLHWIDRTSEDYLTFLAEGLADIPLLLLTTHRSGYTVRWTGRPCYTQIALDLLTEQEAEAMVGTLLGSRQLPPRLVPIIWEKAGGNPLFVEEVTASLLERGALVRTAETISWAADAAIEVPATVQDIIRARIDRLDEPVKRTVQAAAVIGREFGHRLLVRVSEMAAEVQRYLFKHAVTQDVAYQSLLSQRRKELHGDIARAVEELYADRLEDQAAILAYHYARSEQPGTAVEHALRAGDRAAGLSASAEATTYYEEALRILRELPASPRRDGLSVDATVKLAAVATTRQHFERDQVNLESAHTTARGLADRRRTAQVLYWIARTYYVRGNLNEAIEFAEQSRALGEALQDDNLVVWPVNLTGRIYAVVGDYAQATQMLQRCVPLFERLGNLNELATASGILGVALAATGQFSQAVKVSDQGVVIAREIQNLPAEAAAHYYRAVVCEQKGVWARVVDDCRAGLEVAERIPDPFRIYAATCLLGHGLFRLGQAQQGLETLQHGIRLAEQLGTTYLLPWAVTWLSDCHLARNDFEAALACASRALSLVAAGPDVYGESVASRCYGEALGQADPTRLGEAEEHVRRAIALQDEKGIRPQLARSYVALARLFRVRGDGDRAREYLARADALFRALDMQWHATELREAFGAL